MSTEVAFLTCGGKSFKEQFMFNGCEDIVACDMFIRLFVLLACKLVYCDIKV